MSREGGWSELFRAAFKQSRSPMVLLDDSRLVVDANGAFLELVGYARDDLLGQPGYRFVVGGPQLSSGEWAARLTFGHFTGETELLCANGDTVAVQWGADIEVVTGHRLVLLVALSTSRWGRHFRRSVPRGARLDSCPSASARWCGWWRTGAPGRRSPMSCISPATPFARM